MPDLVALIESVSDKALLVIFVMALAAMVEAALGLGVFIRQRLADRPADNAF